MVVHSSNIVESTERTLLAAGEERERMSPGVRWLSECLSIFDVSSFYGYHSLAYMNATDSRKTIMWWKTIRL